MRNIIVFLVAVIFLMPNSLFVNISKDTFSSNPPIKNTTSMIEKINEAFIESQKLRNEYLAKLDGDSNKEEHLVIEIEGELIPSELTKLDGFSNGQIEVVVILEGNPLVEIAKEKGLFSDAKNEVDLESPSVILHKDILIQEHKEFLNKVKVNSINLKIIYEFYSVLNGLYVEVPINQLSLLQKVEGVKEVQFPTIFTVEDRYALEIIRAPQVWANPGVKGEGQVIAIVDTGVDYMHPDLGGGYGAGFKVIGGHDFGDNDSDPMDLNGHGTHVAGIAAAKAVSSTGVNGVAPEAKIVAYKITREGFNWASSGSIIAAFEHMVNFRGPAGEKIITANLSFGSEGGFYSECSALEITLDNTVTSGIFVASSAGNYGRYTNQSSVTSPSGKTTVYPPDQGIVSSPATAGLVTMVGASNNTHQYSMTIHFNVVEPGSTNSIRRIPYQVGLGSPDPVIVLSKAPMEFITIPSYGNIQANYAGLDVKGKIAVVSRDGLPNEDASFVNKIRLAQANGATMIIVHNYAAVGEGLITMATAPDLTIPRVLIGFSHGQWLRDNSGKRIIFDGDISIFTSDVVFPDRMSLFSSWGLTPEMGPKPEVTAPGGSIYSTLPLAMGSYGNKSGTSMSSPYITGIGSLIKQHRPVFTPVMIKTALVNTATVLSQTFTTVPASPRLQGSGRVDIPRALATPALMNGLGGETFISLGDTDERTSMSFSLKVRNLGATALTYIPSTVVNRTEPNLLPVVYEGIIASFTQTGSPLTSLIVPAGGEITFDVNFTIGLITYDNTFAEGFVTLTPTTGTDIALSIPYVFFVGDFQDVSYQNPAPGVTAYVGNLMIDPPRDEPGPMMAFPPLGWSSFNDTWIYYHSSDTPSQHIPLGLDYTGMNLSRNNMAFSPMGSSSKFNVCFCSRLLRGTKEFKIQVRGENLSAPLSIYDYKWMRKGGWYFSWNGGNLSEGDYYVDFNAVTPPDPSTGDTLRNQTITLPFKIDTTVPAINLLNLVRSRNSITIDFVGSDPVKAGVSGIWGFQAVYVSPQGTTIRSLFLTPSTTSYTFDNLVDVNGEIDIVVWDNAGNSSKLSPLSNVGKWEPVNNGLVSKRISSLVIDPQNTSIIYAGTEGGVFKSLNCGNNWSQVNNGLTHLSVTSLTIDPLNPSTLYAGTGGGGVFKSTNGGSSWSAVNTGLTNLNIMTLAIDPLNPSVIYAGTGGGGVFKSTNGGSSWSAVNTGLTYLYINTLAIDPLNTRILYVSIYGAGVFKSTNRGDNWVQTGPGIPTNYCIKPLVIDPSNPQILYVGHYT